MLFKVFCSCDLYLFLLGLLATGALLAHTVFVCLLLVLTHALFAAGACLRRSRLLAVRGAKILQRSLFTYN